MPPASEEKFAADVLACIDDINTLLAELAGRYSNLAMATALAQHAGGALHLLLRNTLCTPQQARQILYRMRKAAFPGDASR